MSSGLCLRAGSGTAATQQRHSTVPRSKQVAQARKRPAAAPPSPKVAQARKRPAASTSSVTPKVPTFAGRSSKKKGNEWVERFNAIVEGYKEERAACKKKGIKFDMTQRQYWDMVVTEGPG